MPERIEFTNSGHLTTDCRKNIDETAVKVSVSNDDIATSSTSTTEKPSPANSICSQNISIVTLDDNGDDSSIANSDDSDLDDAESHMGYPYGNGLAQNRDVNGIVLVNSHTSANGQNIMDTTAAAATAKPNIGSIAVQNSSDITFGNKTFYQGPVTIKQFLYENKKWRPTDQENDNPNFDGSNGDSHGNLICISVLLFLSLYG